MSKLEKSIYENISLYESLKEEIWNCALKICDPLPSEIK